MLLQAIATEIEMQKDPLKLHQAILERLQRHGQPLRWAITQVNSQTQTVTVEAIVTLKQRRISPHLSQ